ncbi:MAG: hypothetical protein KAT04_10040 [Methylococcales bacterium]|nr:hypothetical protein [Methylococcales bacterium]
MEAGDWISLLMVLIACASATVTYVVYRSVTDPEVIVYADTDKKRPSVVNLIIKNIGKGPASDITFSSDRPLPTRAYGIDIPKDMPEAMKDGPIIIGIPYMAPEQSLVLTWGQYGGLVKFIGEIPITIKTKYKRKNSIRPSSKCLVSVSKLDIQCFKLTDSSDHNWGPKIVKELDKTNKELAKIRREISSVNKSETS